MSALIEMRGITHCFPSRRSFFARGASIRALDDVSLTVQRGDILGVIGESGSGKSTLARVICGLVRPSRGEVLISGTSAAGPRPRAQLVFQSPLASLNPRHTVKRTLRVPLVAFGGLHGRAAEERVAELLAMVDLPTHKAAAYPHELSGGQAQRVAIARALGASPDVLVLDEPTSGLDPVLQLQMLMLVADLSARLALTVILISHDLAVIRRVATRLVVMDRGGLVEPTDFRAHRLAFETTSLSFGNREAGSAKGR